MKTVVEHRLWVALKPFFLHCVGKLLGLRGVLIALHRLESSSRRDRNNIRRVAFRELPGAVGAQKDNFEGTASLQGA